MVKPSSKPQRSAFQLFFFDFARLGRLPWRLCKGQIYRHDSGRDFSATQWRQGRVVNARYWKPLLSASAAMDTGIDHTLRIRLATRYWTSSSKAAEWSSPAASHNAAHFSFSFSTSLGYGASHGGCAKVNSTGVIAAEISLPRTPQENSRRRGGWRRERERGKRNKAPSDIC